MVEKMNTFDNRYMITGRTKNEVVHELCKFIKKYGTKENEIWTHSYSKLIDNNSKLEYFCEVVIVDKPHNSEMNNFIKVW